MACVAPRSHGGDAGGSPPRRPTRPVPAECQRSNQRFVTNLDKLRRAYRNNNEKPLTIGFEFKDLQTFHFLGNYASLLTHLLGELIRSLPLNCEWDEIPESDKAHIYPTIETYFDLEPWYNDRTQVVCGKGVYEVGTRVRLALEYQLRLLYRKYKNRIKKHYYSKYETPALAQEHVPPESVWDGRTEGDWGELVQWWSDPKRVARSEVNTVNRSKNTVPTTQGKKPFARGRNEYKVKEGVYEDLVETWRKGHSSGGTFQSKENEERYEKMKALRDQVRAGIVPHMSDKEIVAQIMPSQNKQNVSGQGRKLPGGANNTTRRRGAPRRQDVPSRSEFQELIERNEREMELLRRENQAAQQRAYLAALKADAAQQYSQTSYEHMAQYQSQLGEFFQNYNSNTDHPIRPPTFVPPPRPFVMPTLAPDWAHLVQPPYPWAQPVQPPSIDAYRPSLPDNLQPLQPPYTGTYPITPVTNNNTFNYCYRPTTHSAYEIGSTSQSIPGGSRVISNPHEHDYRSVDELGRDRNVQNSGDDLSGDDEVNDEGSDEEGDDREGDFSPNEDAE